jgi:TusA-related sulfurtransferase
MFMYSGVAGDVCGTSVANKQVIRTHLNMWGGRRMTSKNRMDLRGVISPLNLLKCKSCLAAMDKGDVLEVLLTDVDVVQDLKMIVQRSSDRVVYTKKQFDCVCLGIEKGPRN